MGGVGVFGSVYFSDTKLYSSTLFSLREGWVKFPEKALRNN